MPASRDVRDSGELDEVVVVVVVHDPCGVATGQLARVEQYSMS